MQNMTPIKVLISIFIVVALLYFFIAPNYSDYTDKARVSELLAIAKSLKPKVESYIKKETSPSKIDVTEYNNKYKQIAYVHISDSGQISAFSESFGTYIFLTPTVHKKQVTWVCTGQPQVSMPMECKNAL